MIALALVAFASPALWHPTGDLVARLSHAYAMYCEQLRKNGRADELEMTAYEKLNQMDARWFGPRDSTWTEVRRDIDFPTSGWLDAVPAGQGRVLESLAPRSGEDLDCRDITSSGFEIAQGESMLFTVGRVPEACNETPLMIQKHGNTWGPKEALPDLFNYNVEGLWFTKHYLVMNIKAEYEYAGAREGLAFWDLDGGWIHAVVAVTQVDFQGDSKEAELLDPRKGLGVYLRDLQDARIKESGDSVFIEKGRVKLVFWPAKEEWMLVP